MSAKEDAKWLQWVTQQFETIAGEDREIDLQEFKTALNVKEASVHSRSEGPESSSGLKAPMLAESKCFCLCYWGPSISLACHTSYDLQNNT